MLRVRVVDARRARRRASWSCRCRSGPVTRMMPCGRCDACVTMRPARPGPCRARRGRAAPRACRAGAARPSRRGRWASWRRGRRPRLPAMRSSMRPSCGSRFSAMSRSAMTLMRETIERCPRDLRRCEHFVQHAVDPEAHAQPVLERLDVDVGGVFFDGRGQQRVDEADDRRVIIALEKVGRLGLVPGATRKRSVSSSRPPIASMAALEPPFVGQAQQRLEAIRVHSLDGERGGAGDGALRRGRSATAPAAARRPRDCSVSARTSTPWRFANAKGTGRGGLGDPLPSAAMMASSVRAGAHGGGTDRRAVADRLGVRTASSGVTGSGLRTWPAGGVGTAVLVRRDSPARAGVSLIGEACLAGFSSSGRHQRLERRQGRLPSRPGISGTLPSFRSSCWLRM